MDYESPFKVYADEIDKLMKRNIEQAKKLERLQDTNAVLLEALRNLVDIQLRDERGDPDYLATDEWREEALMIAKSAIAKAKGE